MSSALAHDLRNTLTVVKGYSELVDHMVHEAEGSQSVIAEPIHQIRIAVDRLGRMTEEMLDYARGGTPQLRLADVNLREYLISSISLLSEDAKRRRIGLESQIDIPGGTIGKIDSDAILRVIENLLANARDALLKTEGPKTIRVESRVQDRNLILAIHDNGPGIAAGSENKIFEPFHSGKKSTGLGLATVRNLVRAHGGEIRVDSRSKLGGATFVVELPILESSQVEVDISSIPQAG